MITTKKLRTLKPRTQLRKCAYICHETEQQILRGESVNHTYLAEVIAIAASSDLVSEHVQKQFVKTSLQIGSVSDEKLLWLCDDLYYSILEVLGASPADWDLRDPDSGNLISSARTVFPFYVYADRVRSPFNIGSLMRTADSFGVDTLFLAEGTASPEHPRAKRTARGCSNSVPWRFTPIEELSEEEFGPFFALELGGTPIHEFTFPMKGTVIIGSEEMGVSPEALQKVNPEYGKVSIPLAGTKGSLNVSVAFGILMQYWFSSISGAKVQDTKSPGH